jgi:hypothetical protein
MEPAVEEEGRKTGFNELNPYEGKDDESLALFV